MASSIRGKIADISKGKRIHAIIIEVINGRVTASTNGRLYKGLDVIGGPVVVNQKVWIDFGSGTPIVHAYASSSGSSKTTSVRSITTRIISDSEIVDPDTLLDPGDHSHTQDQIIDLNHDAVKIAGFEVDTTDPVEGQLMEFKNGKWTPVTKPVVDAVKIQGIEVDTTNPTTNQALVFFNNKWMPRDQSGGGSGGGSAHIIELNGVPVAARSYLNFIGNFNITDNESIDATNVFKEDIPACLKIVMNKMFF
jgi:hypothetical protein